MTTPPRPDVDALENLSAAIVVDQERMGANSRSTVGTATDVNAVLRLVWSRLSTPYVGPSFHFSFNLPDGMCPECEGTGKVSAIDESALVDRELSLDDGAITVPNFTVGGWYWKLFAEDPQLDPTVPRKDWSDEQWQRFMYTPPTKVKALGMNTTYEGLVVKVKRLFLDKEKESTQAHVKAFVERIATFSTCPACQGTRLAEAARTATVAGRTLPGVLRDADQRPRAASSSGLVDEPACAPARPALVSLVDLLGSLVEVGLGYLSLDRESGTLSGGEAQRVKMVRHLGSALSDITYVFDEPTIGLHPHDIARMTDLLMRLRDKGNTVLVVEHKPDVIGRADHVIDLGPGAGSLGGAVTYAGDVAGLRASDTLTGRHLDTPARAPHPGPHAHRAARHPRRHDPQPQGRLGRPAARGAHRHHGRCRVGQVLARPRLDRRRVDGCGRRGAGSSTRPRSAGRCAATPRPTPGCSTRSARCSPRPTRSSQPSSPPTRRARAPSARAWVSSTPTSR